MKNMDKTILVQDNQKDTERKNKVYSLLSKIWTFLTLGAWFYFYLKENEAANVLIISQYFTLLIISIFINSDKFPKSVEKLNILGIIAIILIFLFQEKFSFKVNSNKMFFTFVGLLFSAIPLKLLDIMKKDTEYKRSFIPIKATICDYVTNPEGLTGRIFEYNYNGVLYKENDGYYTTRELEPIGTIIEIKIDPKKPNHISLKDISENKLIFKVMYGMVAIGLILFVIALII